MAFRKCLFLLLFARNTRRDRYFFKCMVSAREEKKAEMISEDLLKIAGEKQYIDVSHERISPRKYFRPTGRDFTIIFALDYDYFVNFSRFTHVDIITVATVREIPIAATRRGRDMISLLFVILYSSDARASVLSSAKLRKRIESIFAGSYFVISYVVVASL